MWNPTEYETTDEAQTYREASRQHDIKLRSINRLVVGAIATLAFFTAALTWFVLSEIQRQIEADTFKRLSLNLNQTERVLQIWHKQLARELEAIASNPETIAETQSLLVSQTNGEDLSGHPATLALRKRFDELASRTQHLGFFIISPENINLSSMRDENVGINNLIAEQRPDLIERAFNGETVLVPPIVSDVMIPGETPLANRELPATMFMATPIQDNDGNVIAVLTERFSPIDAFSPIISLGAISAEGSTYAFNQDGLVISDLGDASLLEKHVHFRGQHLSTSLTLIHHTNFFGQPAFAAHQYFPTWNLGIANEIPEKIALAEYYQTRSLITFSLIALLMASVVFTIGLLLMNQRANTILQNNRNRLEGINRRLQNKDEQREEMVYTLSHDLKSPLANIARFSSRLSTEYEADLDSNQKHYLSRIDKNVDRMSVLIESLFRVLQIESGASSKQWLDTGAVINKAITSLDAEIKTADATVQVNKPFPSVFADSDMLVDCIKILVINAIQYRDSNRTPFITISGQVIGRGVILQFEDNGIGISSDQTSGIFRLFNRVNDTSGPGIGLTIVKSVMDKHSGSVSVDSSPGKGSTFTLFFPEETPARD